MCPAQLLVMLTVFLFVPQAISQQSCSATNEIRLGGSEIVRGWVLVCHDAVWKRVCDNDWTHSDAVVTCRQLNYTWPQGAVNMERTGTYRSLPANMTVPDCHGNEGRLSDCPALTRPISCIHYLAEVDCSQCTEVPPHLISPTPPTIISPSSSLSSAVTSLLINGLTLDPHLYPSPTDYDTSSLILKQTPTLKETDTSTPNPLNTNVVFDIGTQTTSTNFNLNEKIIIGVTMAIVVVGCVVSLCLILRCCLGQRKRKITMQSNEAYMDAKMCRPIRFQSRRSLPLTTTMTIVQEPIYEQIDRL